MPRVAFATYDRQTDLAPDDRLAAEALRERGVEVVPAVWDAADVNWSGFDAVVVRSTWDYQRKPSEYARWVRGFQSNVVPLWNPPAAILGNISKTYLTELAARGASVVPGVVVPAGSDASLAIILDRQGWENAVIKPVVSASAHGAWRCTQMDVDRNQERFARQVQAQTVLVQPFLPEIESCGEWSLIFFNGSFSHAVLKRPSTGDFRVQNEYGGKESAEVPPPGVVEQARAILDCINSPLLYARVDGIVRRDRFLLMELEINEPLLFLSYSAEAPRRFADAIIERLAR